ncbi:protein MIS12 homolog [Amphiura filiformis]|uniref:protein MIS12 homolog n=1 Tax=Amphiura filiformis TaxID=82378 RepID=UPI003B20DF87
MAAEVTPDDQPSMESKSEAMDVDQPQNAVVSEGGSEQASTALIKASQKEESDETLKADETSSNQRLGSVSDEGAQQGAMNQEADLKEYEVQYFGFTPQSFANGVYNAMVDYLQDSVEVTQDYILKQFAAKEDVSQEAVKQGSDRLFAVFIDTFNITFDRLESYLLKNIFHIPSHVVLPEDKVNQEHQYTAAEESKLDTEIEELKQRVTDAKYVNARLRQWMQDVEIVLAQLDAFLIQLNTWHAICKQNNVTNISESITFVAGKMQRLKEQLTKVLQQKKNGRQREDPETQIEVDSAKF